jgi:hypothetical protein
MKFMTPIVGYHTSTQDAYEVWCIPCDIWYNPKYHVDVKSYWCDCPVSRNLVEYHEDFVSN